MAQHKSVRDRSGNWLFYRNGGNRKQNDLIRTIQMPVSNDNEYSATNEQAIAYLIVWLKNRIGQRPEGDGRGLEPYGFDLYRDLLRQKLRLEPIDPTDRKIINEKLPFLMQSGIYAYVGYYVLEQ